MILYVFIDIYVYAKYVCFYFYLCMIALLKEHPWLQREDIWLWTYAHRTRVKIPLSWVKVGERRSQVCHFCNLVFQAYKSAFSGGTHVPRPETWFYPWVTQFSNEL